MDNYHDEECTVCQGEALREDILNSIVALLRSTEVATSEEDVEALVKAYASLSSVSFDHD